MGIGYSDVVARYKKKQEEEQLQQNKINNERKEHEVIAKRRAEQLEEESLRNQQILEVERRKEEELNMSWSQKKSLASARYKTDLFNNYIESSRADHIDIATRNGILDGTLPFEDVEKIYKESIGDWNPNIIKEEDKDLYNIKETYGYNTETDEIDWFINRVTDTVDEDFNKTISFAQLHSEVGESNLSEFVELYDDQYQTPKTLTIQRPDGSSIDVDSDAWVEQEKDYLYKGKAKIKYGDKAKYEKGKVRGDYFTIDFSKGDYDNFEDQVRTYEMYLRDYGKLNPDEIKRKIDEFRMMRLYGFETDVQNPSKDKYGNEIDINQRMAQEGGLSFAHPEAPVMEGKYGWLPGNVNAFELGVDLNSAEGYKTDDWVIQGNTDRYRYGSGHTVVQIGDRYLPVGQPSLPAEQKSYQEQIAFLENVNSQFPEQDRESLKYLYESEKAIAKASAQKTFGNALQSLDYWASKLGLDPRSLVEGRDRNLTREDHTKAWNIRRADERRLTRDAYDFNESLVEEILTRIDDEGNPISREDMRRAYEEEGKGIPSAGLKYKAASSDRWDAGVLGVDWMDTMFKTITEKTDMAFGFKERMMLGRFAYAMFADEDYMANMPHDAKWAFYSNNNSLTGEKGLQNTEWIPTAIGLIGDVWATGPIGAALRVPQMVKGGLGLVGNLAPRYLSRKFTVDAARHLTRFSNKASTQLHKLSGGKMGYTQAQRLAKLGIAQSINSRKRQIIAQSHKIGLSTKKGFNTFLHSTHGLGTFFGIAKLSEEMHEHGIYNISLREGLKEYGIGAMVGSVMPLSGAIGNRMVGGGVRYLGQKVGSKGLTETGHKFANMMGGLGGLSGSAVAFPIMNEGIGNVWRTGEWESWRNPTAEDYVHSFVVIGGIHLFGAARQLKTPGFREIKDWTFKKEKFKLKLTSQERESLFDFMKKWDPEWKGDFTKTDVDLRDALLSGKIKPENITKGIVEGKIPIGVLDRILASVGYRPNVIHKIFNTQLGVDKNGKPIVLTKNQWDQTIDEIPVKSEKEGKDLRDKMNETINAGEQLELNFQGSVSSNGNVNLVPPKRTQLKNVSEISQDKIGSTTDVYDVLGNKVKAKIIDAEGRVEILEGKNKGKTKTLEGEDYSLKNTKDKDYVIESEKSTVSELGDARLNQLINRTKTKLENQKKSKIYNFKDALDYQALKNEQLKRTDVAKSEAVNKEIESAREKLKDKPESLREFDSMIRYQLKGANKDIKRKEWTEFYEKEGLKGEELSRKVSRMVEYDSEYAYKRIDQLLKDPLGEIKETRKHYEERLKDPTEKYIEEKDLEPLDRAIKEWDVEMKAESRSKLENAIKEIDKDAIDGVGSEIKYTDVVNLAKELGVKPQGKSKTAYIEALKEHYEAKSIKNLKQPKTLSERIDEVILENLYGKDWKNSKAFKERLEREYDAEDIRELTRDQRSQLEADMTIEAIDKGFEVGSGPFTPQNIKNAANFLVGASRYAYKDLPIHMQKLGNKLGINGTNFKESLSKWSGEVKTQTGKYFNKVMKHLKNYFGKAKEFIREYIKNPKIGLGIEDVSMKEKFKKYKGVGSKAKETGGFKAEGNEKRRILEKASVTKAEKVLAEKSKANTKEAIEEIRRQKAKFPRGDGWAPLEVESIKVVKGKPKIKFKEQSYQFDKIKKGNTREQHIEKGANRVVNDIIEIFESAKGTGRDARNAQTVLKAVDWYNKLSAKAKTQYGSFLNTFVDVIGALSPQTSVKPNFDAMQQTLFRMSRGDYDVSLRQLEKHFDKGGTIGTFLRKNGYKQIEKLNNTLFNLNSNNTSLALLDAWRELHPNMAPKARTFSGNIAGTIVGDATIDVWAARNLNRLFGHERIPTISENVKVSGKVAGTYIEKGKTKEVTEVGRGQFGVGQDVYRLAAEQLRGSGLGYFKNIDARGIQSIMWVREKSLWTKKGWTNKAGSEGSFDLELQKQMLERYEISLSNKIEKIAPTESDANVFKRLNKIVKKAGNILAHKALPSFVMNGGKTSRAYDIELLITKDKNLPEFYLKDGKPRKEFPDVKTSTTPLGDYVKEVVKLAKEAKNDRVIVSEVLNFDAPKTPLEQQKYRNSRPGMEVWFDSGKKYAEALKMVEALNKKGFDGIEFSVDPRSKSTDAMGENKYVGIKLQIIPEIALEKNPNLIKKWTNNPEAVVDWMEGQRSKLIKLADKLHKKGLLSDFDIVDLNTKVIKKENFDEIIRDKSGRIEEKLGGESSLIESVSEALRLEKINIGKEKIEGNKIPSKSIKEIIDIDGLEAGMLGFTPQNMRILRRGLIDTGNFVYNDLPRYVKRAGNKLGINKENFIEKYKAFETGAKNIGAKAQSWFKRVWAQMKNFYNKNRESLRSNPIYRTAEDYVVDYLRNPKLGMSIEVVESSGKPKSDKQIANEIDRETKGPNLKETEQNRRDFNQRSLARIKITENSLLGKEQYGKKDPATITKSELYDLQKHLFRNLPLTEPGAKQITNLKDLYRAAQSGRNQQAEIMMLTYQQLLTRMQTRKRAFNLLDADNIAREIRRDLDYRQDVGRTVKQQRIDEQMNTSRPNSLTTDQVKLTDPEMIRISNRNNKQRPLSSRGKEKKGLKRLASLLNSTEMAMEKYQRETGLPIYDQWLEYRNAQGMKEIYKTKLLAPLNKVMEKYGYRSIQDIPNHIGENIQNFRTRKNIELKTKEERDFNDALTEIYNNPSYQLDYAVSRFMQWKQSKAYGESKIPGVSRENLEMLDNILETQGYKAFKDAIQGVDGFVRADYTPRYKEILQQEKLSEANIGVSKGVLNPQDPYIDANPAKFGNALKNVRTKTNADANLLFIDDIVRDMVKTSNNVTIPREMSTDIKNVLTNDMMTNGQTIIEKGVGGFIGRFFQVSLAMPVKSGRNWLQRFFLMNYTSFQDNPKLLGQILKKSLSKGGLDITKGNSWLKADKDVKEFFLANTSSESTLAGEYLGLSTRRWFDSLGYFGKGIREYLGLYKNVDNGSRWTNYHSVYENIKPLLDNFANGKTNFKSIKNRIYFESLNPTLQNKIMAELTQGNTKYAAMQIADYMAATKTQWRYAKNERSLVEHDNIGRMFMYAQNYTLRKFGNVIADAKNVWWGMPIKRNAGGKFSFDLSSADYAQFRTGAVGMIGTAVQMAIMEQLLNVGFGYRDKYGWGYRLSNIVGTDLFGGLLLKGLETWGDLVEFKDTGISIIGAEMDGTITSAEAEKQWEQYFAKSVYVLENLVRTQAIGYDQMLMVFEAIMGKKHKSLQPLRQALTKYKSQDDGYEATYFQMMQRIVGGTGMNKEQAEWYERNRGRKQYKLSTPPTRNSNWMDDAYK